MSEQSLTTRQRQLRRNRTRVRLQSNMNRPRLSIYRSNQAIYAQIIDASGKVLATANSIKIKSKDGKITSATQVGALIAEAAKSAGVTQVALDRGEYRYHGRVRALAEAAREHGLKF